MALDKATQSMPFVQGADTKTDPNLAQKPAVVENGVFRGGSIQKRPGRRTLPVATAGGSNQSAGEVLTAFNQELLRINGGVAYGLAEGTGQWVAAQGGNNYSTTQLTPRVALRGPVGAYDFCIVGSVGVIAWGESGVRVAVFDVATGVFFQDGSTVMTTSSTSSLPRLIALGNKVVVLWFSTINICSAVLDVTAPTTAPTQNGSISTGVPVGIVSFDAIAYNAGLGVVAYPTNVAGQMRLIGINNAGTVTASPATTNVATGVTLEAGVLVQRDTAGNVYVVYGDSVGASTNYFVRSSSFAAVLAPTAIVTTGNWNGGNADMALGASIELTANAITVVLCRGASGLNASQFLGTAVLGSSGITTAFSTLPATAGLFIQTDISIVGGTAMLGVCTTSYGQRFATAVDGIETTAFVITTAGKTVAQALLYAARANQTRGQSYIARASRSFVDGRTGKFLFWQQRSDNFIVTGGVIALANTALNIVELDVAATGAQALPIVRVGGTLYIGGAYPRVYDGVLLGETGFVTYPVLLVAPADAAVGNLSAGAYQWRYLYSWVNAKGELTRGPVSPPASLTLGAGRQASFSFGSMPLAMRDLLVASSNSRIEVYRTIANGSVFYRQSALDTSAPQNSTATPAAVAYADNVSDADLQIGEVLYTTNGVLDWETPPAYVAACAHKGRLAVLLAEDPYSWAPSSEWVPGETVRFSSFTIQRVPADKGPLVNCASMDGKLILFAEAGAYVVIGDGPDLLGQNNYPPPERVISVDEGPILGTPIVETPMGLMYQGPSGITLLDRALNTSFIGAEVEAWTTGLWRTRSAVLDSANQEVRFLVDMGSDLPGMQMGTLTTTLSGMVLIYNYYYQQWCWWPSYGGKSACFYQDAFTLVQSDGVVWQEQAATYREAGDYYSTVVETPWIKMAGVQGFQRIFYARVLGTYGSDFTLKWEVAYDYDGTSPIAPTWETPEYLDGSGIYTVGAPFQVRMHLGRKCAAVKFRFTDIELRGDGKGMALSDLSFEYGTKKGVFKLPATKTAAVR